MNNILISVIMPVYNGEKYLKESIESILKQSFLNFEFIIIDDGSTDNTESIVESFTDSRLFYHKNSQNLGIVKSLNKGIKLSNGDYIARMDADDISHHTRFEKQLKILCENSAIDVVNTKAYLMNDEGNQIKISTNVIQVSYEAMKYILPLKNLVFHPSVMVKAQVLKQYYYREGIDAQHVEDLDLWLRMVNDGCVIYTINEYLLYYRINPNSINRTKNHLQIEKVYKLSSNFLETKFGFKFSKCVLLTILGDYSNKKHTLIKDIKIELDEYFNHINKVYHISKQANEDIMYWKKYKIFLLILRFFQISPFREKAQIVWFFLSNMSYFLNKNLMAKLIEINFHQARTVKYR